VLEGVLNAGFTVLERGIYYLEALSGQAQLQFYDIASRRSTTVSPNLGDCTKAGGLSAALDGRTILFARLDSSVDDLMLVENFR
jgi:hypothetical protein